MTIHPFLSEKDFFDENFDAGTKKILDYFFYHYGGDENIHSISGSEWELSVEPDEYIAPTDV